MLLPIANVLQPLIDACQAVLEFWHDDVLGDFDGSWGVAIILLTFTVRLFILPLTFRGVKSMQRLQTLQPEIKKIQERYKDDKQRLNQEVMAFYQREKVNPLGSCLPLVLQIPFFISLFYLLRSDPFKADIADNPGFLVIDNLAEKVTDPVLLGVLIVLYIGTQLAASAVTAISADPTQQRIMLALPFVFAIFIINFQAGLIVYWITTNVWTIGQQLLVKKLYPKPEPIDGREAGTAATSPARGKPAKPDGAAAAASARAQARRRQRRGEGAAAVARARRRSAPAAAGRLPLRMVHAADSGRAQPERSHGRGGGRRRSARRKWAAMKELEPRFPGVTAECVELRGGRARRRRRPRGCAAQVDVDAWREAAERAARGAGGARARARDAGGPGARAATPTVDVDETDEEIRATVNGDDLGLLIGKHGRRSTPCSIWPIALLSAGQGERKQVVVDAAGYRERREARCTGTADRAVGRGAASTAGRSSSSRCARSSARSSTCICASARTWRPTARATSRTAASSSRPAKAFRDA